MRYIAFDDIPLSFATVETKRQRIQRAQFGDGYSQVLTDGLNRDLETWSCQTVTMPIDEVYSIESYLLSLKGQAITWTPPNNQKSFARPVVTGELNLGYTDLSSLTVDGYTRPTDYTVNLATGLITSVTIPDDTVLQITLAQNAKTFLLSDGWTINRDIPEHANLTFELTRVYL